MTDWYCQLPFRHVYVDSDGLAPCCQLPRQNTTLDQWPTNAKLLRLQQDHLSGEPSAACTSCYQSESRYGISLRLEANQDYNNKKFDSTNIDFVDFRSINICNFRCRTCNPKFSNGIAQETNKIPELVEFFHTADIPKTLSVSSANTDWILHNLPTLKRIMFTGGEPTRIAEVRNIIEQVHRHYPEIQILITTNASFEDDFWFDISHDLNVHWTVSVDAVGPRAAIVRHGSDWQRIAHNVSWLCANAASVNINSVISSLNVFGLAPLLEFGRQMYTLSLPPQGRHGDQGCRHQFHVCQLPYYLAAVNWPPELQAKALQYVQNCAQLDLLPQQHDLVQRLVTSIKNNIFDEKIWQQGERYNQILDQARNQNHKILYEPQV